MLEHPSISQYLRPNEGDNLWSADNQQERLVRIGWILGFVDGEGCFSIGFVRQPGRTDRHGYKTGGFGARAGTQAGLQRFFVPETVDDIEVGVKPFCDVSA